jgi:protein-tyrosine kinase
MSRVYEALRRIEKKHDHPEAFPFPQPGGLLDNSTVAPTELGGLTSVNVKMTPSSRLVALSQPRSLGAEKFRALATRLENLRQKKEMRSLQITSGGINEGKTLVAANLAVTLARHGRSKVLLVEGDLHRPGLADLLGLNDLKGLSHWWLEQAPDFGHFLCQLNDMPLWFLSAGAIHEQPSDILQSTRFAEAFNPLAGWFEWIVVDSTPMLPGADANLWSRLVDGTLLVVRERVASVRALRKGLESLDNLKLIGTVLNEASESERTRYVDQYHAVAGNSKAKVKA